MSQRDVVDLAAPSDGWFYPWPNVFELAGALPTDQWTLVGGLMVQAHEIAHAIPIARATSDVDVLLHVEIVTGVARAADNALTGLGYVLREPWDARDKDSPHYRYVRDVGQAEQHVDVMTADHVAPRVRQSERPQALAGCGCRPFGCAASGLERPPACASKVKPRQSADPRRVVRCSLGVPQPPGRRRTCSGYSSVAVCPSADRISQSPVVQWQDNGL